MSAPGERGERASDDGTRPSLLARVRDPQDERSWREFDARYQSLILRYCRMRGMKPDEADDVRQIVMLTLVKRLPTFEYGAHLGRFRNYLGRVVENAIRRYVESKDRRSLISLDQTELDLAQAREPEQEALWEEEWVRHHTRYALAFLRKSSSQRSYEVFDALLQGGSPDEVAARFEMKLAAVYQVQHRMRKRMREQIASQLHDEEFPEQRRARRASS